MKLIVAPWGDPKNWKEITYKFKGEEITSLTSLKILQKIIKPERTIIIGLDTLAERGLNYREVRKNVKEKIDKYSSKFGLKNYDIVVAPGIGAFPTGIFNGNALDYYYYILAELSISLLDYSNKTLDLHLDLTHGLNLMPVLTYRATKEILELFSIFKQVRLTAYNADPWSTTTSSLSINIIEDVIPTPKPFDRKIKQGRTLEPINLNSKERRLLAHDLDCTRELDPSEISAFLGALYNGLPLALFRFYPANDKLREIISKTLEIYEKYIKVAHTEKLDVNRRVKFSEDFETYLFACLTASLLEKLELVSSQKKEVKLSEIEKLTSNLFKFDERFKNRIENDIYGLKRDIENRNIDRWKIYNEILEKPTGEPNSRHFLAHSGFERNVVEIKKDIGNVYIRYREGNIKTIRKLCQRGLKEI
jgi:CRISPR-associated protein Csx1